MMPLNMVMPGQDSTIVNIVGGDCLTQRLMEMGIRKGIGIRVLQNDRGPLIVAVGESRVILGRGMAQKVLVSEVMSK